MSQAESVADLALPAPAEASEASPRMAALSAAPSEASETSLQLAAPAAGPLEATEALQQIAAPAATPTNVNAGARELTEWEKRTSRILLMSWNPGAGCRNLSTVIDESGYHVAMIQEGMEDRLKGLSADRWSWEFRHQQVVAARKPSLVVPLGGKCPEKRCRWFLAAIHFDVPRATFDKLVVLSVHLNNQVAKKPVASIDALREVLQEAIGISPIHVIAGDINMARWTAEVGGAWKPEMLALLKEFALHPVADFSEECCFIGVDKDLLDAYRVQGSSWGEKLLGTPGDAGWHKFASQVGCRLSSHDVHWPLTLSIRLQDTSTGTRKRSHAAIIARRAKQAERWSSGAWHDRSSGSSHDRPGGSWHDRSSGWDQHDRSSGWSDARRSSDWEPRPHDRSSTWDHGRSSAWGQSHPSTWDQSRSSDWVHGRSTNRDHGRSSGLSHLGATSKAPPATALGASSKAPPASTARPR